MTDLLARAKDFYGAALSDPQTAAAEFLSQDFLLENPLPEGIPFGGSYEGAEGFLRYLGGIAEAIEMGPLEFDEWVVADGVVVARGREESLVRATGERYRMRFVHWLSFDGTGKITAMREFNDTAEMARAFGL